MSDDKDKIGVNDLSVIDATKDSAETRVEREESKATKEYEKEKGSSKLSMAVKVYSPFKDYFEGRAFSLSGVNLTGPFDILPKHHNFISLLTAGQLVIRTPKDDIQGGPVKILISGGIIHVKGDNITVFLDV